MVRPRLMLRILLSLLAVALFAAPTAASVSARPSDGFFRSWSVIDVAPHPTSGALYLLDSYQWILTIDGATGRPLSPVAMLATYPSSLRAIAVDGVRNVVHALTGTRGRGGDLLDNYRLVTLSADLQPVANVSLSRTLSPPPDVRQFEQLSDSLLVDKNSCVYVVRRLANSSLLVHVLQDGRQIDVWMAPFATSFNVDYIVAIGSGSLLHFRAHNSFIPSTSQPLYITTTGGLLVATLNLAVNASNSDYYYSALAVSPSSGNIAVSSGYGIALFTTAGVRVASFAYLSPLASYSGFRCMAFDANDRLLAVDIQDELGVQVISSNNGDLLGSLSSAVPQLSFVRSMVYERQSNSLLVSQPTISDVPVMRLDADRGWLVQQYPSIGRLDSCFPITSTVVPSGNIYTLLRCYGSGSDARKLLNVVSPAGQLRRQVELAGWGRAPLQSTLVVSEDKQQFYVITANGGFSSAGGNNKVLVFSFNGSNVYNYTDPAIGFFDDTTQLLLVGDDTLGVLDPNNYRIALLDLSQNSFFGNQTIPQFTYVLSVAYAGKSWYRSEVAYDFSSYTYNLSINQYAAADGSLQVQYMSQAFGDGLVVTEALTVDPDSRRLYALQNSYGDLTNSMVMWWNLQRQDGDEQRTTAQQQAGVRRVPASGVRALNRETGMAGSPRGEGVPAAAAGDVQSSAGSRGSVDQLVAAIQKRGGRVPEWMRQLNATRAETM